MLEINDLVLGPDPHCCVSESTVEKFELCTSMRCMNHWNTHAHAYAHTHIEERMEKKTSDALTLIVFVRVATCFFKLPTFVDRSLHDERISYVKAQMSNDEIHPGIQN